MASKVSSNCQVRIHDCFPDKKNVCILFHQLNEASFLPQNVTRNKVKLPGKSVRKQIVQLKRDRIVLLCPHWPRIVRQMCRNNVEQNRRKSI